MTKNRLLTPLAVVGLLALTAGPALAQHRGGSSHSASQGRSSSGYRGVVAVRGSVGVRGGVVVHGGGYVGHSSYYRPYYSHPYYSFRPHVSLGFGVWAGTGGVPYYYGYPRAGLRLPGGAIRVMDQSRRAT